MFIDKVRQIWKIKDLRNNILFVLLMLTIFRLAVHIPIPGINTAALKELFGSNQLLGLMDLFSGGGMKNFSIVMMGVAPYITSSIIFQLLGMISPKVEEMQKEESGRQKINSWTRWATVPLAALQAYGMLNLLQRSSRQLITSTSVFDTILMITTITAGTVFLMWLGELISKRKIGNGISFLIFAGIVAALPGQIGQLSYSFDSTQIFTLIGLVLVAILTVVGVVVINEGERNIPIQYARQMRGNNPTGGQASNLPLRVNMAGVIPIIFAISLIMIPPMLANFFIHAKTAWLANFSNWTINIFQNQLFYGIIYFLLVFGFTYFYTEVVFHPDQIAENLQKGGGFIPGIRPGKPTADYISYTTHKIILTGALFLGLIAIMPLIIRYFTGIQSLAIGGTSLLIVVSVVIETVKQIQAQITMREYDNV
ncbi:MAG: preprotein translocase subunit SecY [Candidatus Falkowbacteria bacterium]